MAKVCAEGGALTIVVAPWIHRYCFQYESREGGEKFDVGVALEFMRMTLFGFGCRRMQALQLIDQAVME